MQLLYGSLVWTRDIQTLFHYVSLAKIKEVPLIRTDEIQIKRWWQNGDRMVTGWNLTWLPTVPWSVLWPPLSLVFAWENLDGLWPVMASYGRWRLRDVERWIHRCWSCFKSCVETCFVIFLQHLRDSKVPVKRAGSGNSPWSCSMSCPGAKWRARTDHHVLKFFSVPLICQSRVSRCLKSKDSQEVTVARNPGTSILHWGSEHQRFARYVLRCREHLKSLVFGEEMQPDLILCNAVISASNSGHAEQNDLAAWCCMVLHGATLIVFSWTWGMWEGPEMGRGAWRRTCGLLTETLDREVWLDLTLWKGFEHKVGDFCSNTDFISRKMCLKNPGLGEFRSFSMASSSTFASSIRHDSSYFCQALWLLWALGSYGPPPDDFSYCSAINACGEVNQWQWALWL